MTSQLAPFSVWLRAGLGLIYPEVCQICGEDRAQARDGFLCNHCRAQIEPIRPPFCDRCGLPFEGHLTTTFECSNCRELAFHFQSARSAVAVKTVIREVIHRYKYQRAMWFEPCLAGLLVSAAQPALAGQPWDFIVPVPLFPLREREREFNQAVRLARPLSQATGIPLNTSLLRRITPTTTQTALTRSQRQANMTGAFAPSPGARLTGQNIVLVDDVFTTGATTNACAAALHQIGAGTVCVWTVARGL